MRALRIVVGCALSATSAGAGDRPEGRPFATRSVTLARHGMVAAAHPLAVQVGVDVLKQGGSAVDAAIAVNAALSFLEPVACGLGGDLFAMVWDPASRTLHGLNASGRAPAAATIQKIPAAADGTIPLHSPYAWTVLGAVAAGQPDSGLDGPMGDRDIQGNVLNMLLAGEDTTANTLAWMIHLLALNPAMAHGRLLDLEPTFREPNGFLASATSGMDRPPGRRASRIDRRQSARTRSTVAATPAARPWSSVPGTPPSTRSSSSPNSSGMSAIDAGRMPPLAPPGR